MEPAVNKFDKPVLKKRNSAKVKEWLRRFLPAEIAGTILALTASYITNYTTKNAILAAYAGSIGDTVGFYTVVVIQSSTEMHRELKRENKNFSAHSVFMIFRNMLLDYGIAEVVDSLFLRPFLMYVFPLLLNNYPLGVLVGKILSDIGFYIPVVVSYELRLMFSKKTRTNKP